MRLNTGDYIEGEPYLKDDIYMWFYYENGSSELEGSIAALESIINNIALAPKQWRSGDVWEETQTISSLERRLEALKARRNKSGRVPIVIRSDRKNWKDFDELFG